ncbi:MAG: hypothetical protein P1V51_04195 [Deltaproteobacteria bacterium]|nr:hypothetical protein [Deltaproteobacteria bacterium]
MKTDPHIVLPKAELLEQIGKGLRRVKSADESPDERGFRTIWHHGPMKTDLFSFVGPDRQLARQELVFLGKAVSWDERDGLSTGVVNLFDSPSAPASQQVSYGDSKKEVDPLILLQASRILRVAPDPDYYTQSLRRLANAYLIEHGTPATEVKALEPEMRAELRRLFEVSQEVAALPPREEPAPRSEFPWKLVGGILALLAAVGVGAGLALLLAR